MPEPLTNLGNALRSLGRMAESEAALRRILAQRPTEITAYNNLAITLQGMDRPQEALALLDLAIALDPKDPESRRHRLHLRDGRACFDNSAAERAMRPVALGRRNWTFAGSDAGGHRAAAIYS